MYVGHNLDTKDYSVSVNYYEGLNQTKNAIKPNKEYDSTKDYSVRINIKGKEAGAIISPNLTVKPQIISGDFRRLFQTETPVTVCGQ